MERVVARSRSRQGSRLIAITPAADGWRVSGAVDGEPARPARTMEEAAEAVPAGALVRLSLPVSAVLVERMRLPTTDLEELGGMVILQLEKTLPYSGEELTSAFDIIHQQENECDLMAIAVSNEQLDGLCEPLRKGRKLPDEVTVFAIQLAAKFPGEEVLALIYREADATILAVAQHGKLVAAHACPTTERRDFLAELPRMLLAAELEGAPVNFTRVIVEREIAGWMEGLKEQFGNVPMVPVPVDGPLEPGPVNLVPAGWTQEQRKEAQQAKVRDWLAVAGAIYLFLLLVAAGYVIWLQRQVGAIDRQVMAASPAVDSINDQTARWTALEGATDPTRYTVEIMQQIYKSIPSPDLRVTVFDHTPLQFMVEGEAPTANMAEQYMEALRANPDLKAFHFDSGPPEILPNEHAHFPDIWQVMTLSSREKLLALAMGGTVAVLLNLLLLSAFARRTVALRSELAERKLEWGNIQSLLGEQSLWAARDAALTAKQPKLTNENAAGVELLDMVNGLAKAHQVTTENEVIPGIAKTAWYRSVPVSMDTHSTWSDLIAFLYALQKPDQFIVCEDANIQVDPADQTKMLGHFKIARWYSP